MIHFNLTCDKLEAVRLPEIHDIETGYRLIIRKNLSDESQEYQIKNPTEAHIPLSILKISHIPKRNMTNIPKNQKTLYPHIP